MKSAYKTIQFVSENKTLVVIGLIGVVLIWTWAKDIGVESTGTNY